MELEPDKMKNIMQQTLYIAIYDIFVCVFLLNICLTSDEESAGDRKYHNGIVLGEGGRKKYLLLLNFDPLVNIALEIQPDILVGSSCDCKTDEMVADIYFQDYPRNYRQLMPLCPPRLPEMECPGSGTTYSHQLLLSARLTGATSATGEDIDPRGRHHTVTGACYDGDVHSTTHHLHHHT